MVNVNNPASLIVRHFHWMRQLRTAAADISGNNHPRYVNQWSNKEVRANMAMGSTVTVQTDSGINIADHADFSTQSHSKLYLECVGKDTIVLSRMEHGYGVKHSTLPILLTFMRIPQQTPMEDRLRNGYIGVLAE